ncbi:MAG TPA: cytochrome c [Bdellovibrionales bacterium]|nr:cytochrome c [Bdellovibrionales bacterium]
MRKPILALFIVVNILAFQNCGQGFNAVRLSDMNEGASQNPDDESDPDNEPDDQENETAGLTTSHKAVGDTATSKVISWNLASDVTQGTPIPGVTLSISIVKFTPTDGSQETYFLTAPTITTGSQAIELRSLKMSINGVRDDIGTTFTGLDRVIAANQTVVLSSATLLYQLDQPANANDTIAMGFSVLWPSGVPKPTPTPAPNLPNGKTLYSKNCAACHGALSVSTKRMSTASEIGAAINGVTEMSLLKGKLTQAEITAVANALK